MATAEQVKSLVKAHCDRDDQKFKTVVLQIAAHEAKLGHGGFAQELKKDVSSISKPLMACICLMSLMQLVPIDLWIMKWER